MAVDAAPADIDVEVRAYGRIRHFSPLREDHLLKIGQEAIANAIRHGQATRIQIELDYRRRSLVLRISDNGCGFDPDAWSDQITGHWGLKNMRERAETIGGRLGITSQPGHGTSIEVLATL